MIDEITIASNRGQPATCLNCKKKIKSFEIRGLLLTKHDNNYVCEKCLIKELDVAISKVEIIKNEYKELSKLDRDGRIRYLNRIRILNKL